MSLRSRIELLEELIGDLEPGQSLPESLLEMFTRSGIPKQRVVALWESVFGGRPFEWEGVWAVMGLLQEEPEYSHDVIFAREDAQDE